MSCTCPCLRPHAPDARSHDHREHGWGALGQVEVVHFDTVCDLSALILMNTQALPIRMKILLDRLFSVLTHTHVLQILHTHGWTLHDYARGYMLQDSPGRRLDRWAIVSPEDELLMLRQFLRFGETRSIVELMVTPEELAETFRLAKKHDDGCNGYAESLKTRAAFTEIRKRATAHPVGAFPKRPAEFSQTSSGFLRDRPPFQDGRSGDQREPAKSLATPLRGTGARFAGHSGSEDEERGARPRPDSPRKARVSCGSCEKSFYDKGTLKIHYNAVHLKIKHRCTVRGCSQVFSSLRSRNRHSANPNPRLHLPAPQGALCANQQPPRLDRASPARVFAPAESLRENTHAPHAPASSGSVWATTDTTNAIRHAMPIPASRGCVTDTTAKKKPRKSSTPLKIQTDRDDDEIYKIE